ncbi:hypothetical protein AcW1_004584 [Taiwanofungus camphoratus]|nr:hypothetical protein AcW2_006411 [Antrodia cinnamomea]KAI0939605.1 hypothetical protein AcV5_000970 [Antrodia cinnamomea]KAI0952520.1 hypothetical protein AcV7_008298 [Antrodia cinnamomea]KAI0959893.1 hypothetical protein AcW1_004584 [Antrodia cinnamomea]
MAVTSLFNVEKQLTFYGAYHNNPTNILIHQICVPIILWTFHVLAASLPVPSFFPSVHAKFNDYLAFDLNWSAVHAFVYIVYYYVLEPTAACLYTPQIVFSLLTATAFSHTTDGFKWAAILHFSSWIAQFIGHFGPEGRSPALIDNFIGAVVLAPFFVHLELLFKLGYNPELHKAIQNGVGTELASIRKAEGEKRRTQKKE